MLRKLVSLLFVIAAIAVFLYANNHWLQTTNYSIESPKIPASFDGLKIVQLSDVHDATFGEKQIHLVNKVKKLNPDVVFITGDIIDSNRYNLQQSLDLVEQLLEFVDIYYVTGNHEIATQKADEIKNALRELGVYVLSDESIKLTRGNESIAILGIEDPLQYSVVEDSNVIESSIQRATEFVPEDEYKLLLSHRPEFFQTYVDLGIDVTFSGHAHGGQIRIPGLGGLVAPGQGWLPKYTSGSHAEGDTNMIVNRGLGNSIMPYRVFNRPEIVVVTLKSLEK